jgi:S1-C subfamily serine protease|tara:strand:+ start:68 stop:1294 length:1227 start_codon:yes stop_codon:yes gene_type:complete
MKKLLITLFLFLLWCKFGVAASLTYDDLKKSEKALIKNPEDVLVLSSTNTDFIQSIISTDYLNYFNDYFIAREDCLATQVKLKFPAYWWLELVDCTYRNEKNIIYKYNLNLLFDIAHERYLNLRRAAKKQVLISKNTHDAGSFLWTERSVTINAFQKMEMFLERVYLTEINNDSKPKGLEIDDEEIISASSGSGFFVSKEGHIITNFHVIDNCNVVKVNFKGKQVNTKIFAIDKKNDLAIIQTDINPSKVFPVSNNDVTLLQDVIVAGYPLGKNISSAIKMHKGSVTALTGYEDNYSNFQTDATINQGNSGGPIIDKYGNVVGIAVATWVEQGVQGIHFGIKSSVLKTFANSKELNFLPPNRKEISEKKLGELISDSTIYLECWMTGAKIKKMIAKADSKKAFFSEFK